MVGASRTGHVRPPTREGIRPIARLRSALRASVRSTGLGGWLYVLPALGMFAWLVLGSLGTAFQYSLYHWDGVGESRWAGLENYSEVFRNDELVGAIIHSFILVGFYSVIPVTCGLVMAAVIHGGKQRSLGSLARTILFVPQLVPLVAAGIAWRWMFATTGTVNQILSAIGLGSITRAWLADFDMALPAVGLIGVWVLLGFCTVLLLTGMTKIDPTLYEAARIDGAGPVREFFAVTLPSIRNQIAVCLTVTVILSLASFDIVFIATGGGPGTQTMVPGVEIYRRAFAHRQVGLASAYGLILMVLVMFLILPIQRLSRTRDE